MTKKIILFIADFFADQVTGGGELNNSVLMELLSSRGYEIRPVLSHQVTHLDILYNDNIIVANFVNLSEENKIQIQNKNYVIYEHDHKYLKSRNPGLYAGYKVPNDQIINKEFYQNAKAILCQSNFHAEIIRKNLKIDNVVNLSGNLWSEEHLQLLEEMNAVEKIDKCAIMKSNIPHKNTQEAIQYCEAHSQDYELLETAPVADFLRKLGEYKTLVFLPKTPETLSRIVVEARMMGMNIKTTQNVGAIHEDWFEKKGIDLINLIRQKREEIPNKVLECLGVFADNHFKIIVPFYNVEQWIKLTLKSIKLQDYENFECILMNDMSTDNSKNIAIKYIGDDKRFRLVENRDKKYVLENICNAIELANPSQEDIIVILDGDDWFAGKKVLSTLNEVYNKEKCWLTYGSYIEYPQKIRGKFAREVPKEIIDQNMFRGSPWMTSHLRSWKYGLWKHIDQQESFCEPNATDNNNHFSFCWDLAYMFPLLELAGHKIHYIPDILYVYNRQNPLNVDKIKHQTQLAMEQKIRNMKKYSPLKEI